MDKKNFEKDIDVPSKRRIMDDYNAKDCEQCSPDSVCCYCKNIACYQLEETIDGLLKIQYQLADNNKKLRQTLTEIKEIARVNSINTCWTAINLCADCDEIKECGLQSPFEKLKAIIQKISECEVE